MILDECLDKEYTKLLCVGTGLIALDMIIEESNNMNIEFLAGGSCGNVLTILSYLGWESYPIAYLGEDAAAEKILSDLELWKVNTNFLYKCKKGNTPIIIEKFGINKKGKSWHRFEWNCPFCGVRFPKYKSIPLKEIREISEETPKSEVFYFDKVRKSSLEIAKKYKKDGALVVFEPSRITNIGVFNQCLDIADIVKYSRENLGSYRGVIENKSVPLQIETLDKEGLMYKLNCNKKIKGEWKKIPAYSVTKIKDTVGAGDWCTAGIIHILGKKGQKGLGNAKEKDIRIALKFGQLLSAFKCYYKGARGCMYHTSEQYFNIILRSICEGKDPLDLIERSKKEVKFDQLINLCPFCGEK